MLKLRHDLHEERLGSEDLLEKISKNNSLVTVQRVMKKEYRYRYKFLFSSVMGWRAVDGTSLTLQDSETLMQFSQD